MGGGRAGAGAGAAPRDPAIARVHDRAAGRASQRAGAGGLRQLATESSFHNWPALAAAMPGNEISDFPLCNKSFNLSYAGHDL
jgi:hypothetical protein